MSVIAVATLEACCVLSDMYIHTCPWDYIILCVSDSIFICMSRNEQKLNLLSLFSRGWDNAISVVAMVQARQPGNQSLLPGRCKKFLFCIASRKAFCPMGSGCSNGRDKTVIG